MTMIWYMISYTILKKYDVILHIIFNIIADPFLAAEVSLYDFAYDIIYILYDFAEGCEWAIRSCPASGGSVSY